MPSEIHISSEDLPIWMRQARRGTDWGVIIAIVFGLAAAWSFMVYPQLPRTNANENHIFRTEDYAAAIREGRLYPRWSSHALQGYGAPIPNYYPPAAHYAAAVLQVLFTDDATTAVRLIYIIALCLSSAMTYVFVTRWIGAAAGLLASVLYVYSPYVSTLVPHVLGDLPSAVALALMPSLLWSMSRLAQLNRAFDLLLTALIMMALLVCDLRTALITLLLALLMVSWSGWSKRQTGPLLRAILAGGVGFGLSAFYWLPALLEQNLVQWRAPFLNKLPLAVNLETFITPFRQIDLDEQIITPQLTLGIAAVLFSVGAAAVIILLQRRVNFQTLFLGFGIIIAAGNVLLFPREIWLLGPAALCLAVGSTGILYLRDLFGVIAGLSSILYAGKIDRWHRLFLPSLIVFILFVSLPVWLSPPPLNTVGSTKPQAQIAYEQQGFGLAVLPPNSPVPVTIANPLAASRFLLGGYANNSISKISSDQLTVNTEISLLSHDTHSDRFQIRINRPITLHVLTAFFPGWQALVNGTPIRTEADTQTGLINITLPETQNAELVITLGATPIRTIAWLITWIILVLMALVTLQRLRKRDVFYDDLALLSVPEARLIGIVLVCFSGVLWLVNSGSPAFGLRARPGYALDNNIALENRTDRGLEALAYRLEKNTYQIGDTIHFSIYWRTARFLPENYQTQVTLTRLDQGIGLHRSALRHPGGYPTRRWNTQQYVSDPYTITLSRDIVPGEYQITIEVFACNPDCTADRRLNFFSKSGSSIGQSLFLPTTIMITP